MATIRQLQESDLPSVSELFLRITPDAAFAAVGPCASYLGDLLFRNPWRDLNVPSWVAEEKGRITGFYLLLPRSMRYQGQLIRVAVGCQISVDPEFRRSLTALELARNALNGPQDLTIADGAHERSRDIWVALGGKAPLIFNLHWIRPLRPARYLLSALQQRKVLPAAAAHAARPLAALADGAAARLRWNRFAKTSNGVLEETLQFEEILDGLPQIVGPEALQPAYDHDSLAWLLEQTAAKTGAGALRGRSVRSESGDFLGWYLYAFRRGGTCEVLQLAAREEAFDRVLCALLADAWRQGAAALRGRGEPGNVEALSARHCWFRREGKCTLVHTRRKDLSDVFESGKVFFSRLEGEWWLRHVRS